MVNVLQMLATIRPKPTDSPVEWLMGDHWAEIDLGRSSRLSLLKRAEHDLRELDGRGGGSGRGAARPRASTTWLAKRPEAMVKLVRSGGTSDLRGMKGQTAYLQKNGTVTLEASERHFGAELSGSLLDDTLASWSRAASRDAKADLTSHFVVSFPAGTDELAAYRAGRAWAEAMFDHGTYGDVWDHYTAFHTDTAHPHMHVVVSRRGVENGTWLKVSRRGPIDYDELRFVQVEVAAQEGIELQATPRFSRALHERPISDERQRIDLRPGERMDARPIERAPNPYRAALDATQVLVQARSVQADADIVRDADRALADTLDGVADDLRAGRGGQGSRFASERPFTTQDIQRAEELVMTKRDELARNIDRVDAELATIPDGAARAPLEREASKLKGRAAELLPGRTELRNWRSDGEAAAYRGLGTGAPQGDREKAIHERTTRDVERIANEAGLDGAVVVSRYAGEGASKALTERWRRDEIEMFKRSRPIGFSANPERLEEAAADAYTSVHRRIASQFTAARNELAELQAKRDAVRHEAQRYAHDRSDGWAARDVDTSGRAGTGADRARTGGDAALSRAVRDVLFPEEIASLERGDLSSVTSITSDGTEQARIARRFVEAERQTAEGVRREQLQRTAEQLERNDEATRRQAKVRERDEKGRGLDL